jgi:PAS domain S-box-containing protein
MTEQGNADDVLRIDGAHFRRMVENAPTAIFVNESGGIFRYVNAAAVELFGVGSADALLGRQYLDFVHPEEREAAAERVRHVSEGGRASGYSVRRIVRPNGEVRFISVIGIAFREGERRLVQGIAQDITEQVRDEALRRESEAKFAAAFQGSADPMCIVRTRDGLMQEVNDAYLRRVGYSREEVIGRTSAELGLSTDPLLRGSMIEKLRTEGSVRDLPWKLRTKAGEMRDVLHSAYRIDGADEPRHVAIIRDVTEQYRREREIRESEAKFAAAFHANVDAMVISRIRDGLILDVNEAYMLLTGYRREELVGRTTLELDIVADPEGRVRRAELAQKQGFLRDVPSPLRTRSGKIRDCLQSSYSIEIGGEKCWVSVMRDVTDAQEAAEALRQSEERLTQAIRVADIGIFDHDQRNDSIYWSPRQRSIYGWDGDEPVTLQKYIHTIFPEDGGRIGAAVRSAHDPRGDGKFDVEYRAVRRDGEIRWLSTRAQTFFEGEGPARRPVRTVGAVIDITERKRVDEAIRHSEALLAEAQRTAHLGNFERDFVTNQSTWSDETYRLLGCEPGSIEPRFDSVQKFVHPDDREKSVAAYEYALKPESGGKYEVEYRVLRSDGVERILHHRATVTFDAQGKPVRIFGTSQDVTETRRAEQALRETEQRFQTLVESVPDPVVVHVDGRYVYANPAALELIGAKSVDEIIGRDALTIVHPDSRELVRQRISRQQKGEVVPRNVDQRWLRADGTPIDVLVTDVPIELGGKRAVHVIARDISERKSEEEARRELLQRLQKLASQLPGVVYQYKLRPDGTSCFPYASEGIRDIYRVTPEQVREDASEVFAALHPDDVLAVSDAIQVSARSLTPWRQEYRVRFKDGTERWLFGNAAPEREADGSVLWHGFISDVTQRKRAEEALRASEERYRSVVSAMVEGVVLEDSSGKVLAFNERAHQLLGLRKDDTKGAAIMEAAWRAIHEDGSPFRDEELPASVVWRTGMPCLDVTMGLKKPDGSLVWLMTSAVPVFSAGWTAVESVVTTYADFSDRRRLEEELRKLNRELESRIAERTAQLQESNMNLEAFSYSVSHDLRAPLRHVVGYIDLLKKSLTNGVNEEAMRRMDVISNAAKRMGSLIDDLLSFSRIGRQGMNFDVVDTNAIVRGVLEELQPETQGRDIEWHVTALPGLIADRGLLKLVFTNLISNAVKFTRGRTPARIEVGCVDREDDSAEHVVFVKDNGAGFDMRYSDKLFGVFQRLHSAREFEGTGIGLANCRRIIERHGGRIWGEGVVGGGATFFFTMPKKKQPRG